MPQQETPSSLPVPDASTEKEFLVNALEVWLSMHGKNVPSLQKLSRSIIYSPPEDGDKIPEEDWIDVDGG